MKYLIFIYWAITISPDQSQEDYIKSNMLSAKICQLIYGVPVSIQFAQAIYESGGGRSYIAKNSNNHFGIKYYPEAFDGDYFADRAGQRWRAYPNVFIGYLDHAYFIWLHYRSLCWGSYKKFKNAGGYGETGYWGRVIKFVEAKKFYKYD